MALSTTIVGYLLLFTLVGFGFVLFNILIGSLLRPNNPHAEKLEIYECGEPTIGSSFVQFDLRFYVVALLFILFDVEVAFFFPWAVVLGKAAQLASSNTPIVVENEAGQLVHGPGYEGLMAELGVPTDTAMLASSEAAQQGTELVKEAATKLVITSVVDIVIFFSILLIGFAYVWK
ncbi:MAG: NADH-quinone oxidoreductase subunit A, partial [Pirellulaceae bacterium]